MTFATLLAWGLDPMHMLFVAFLALIFFGRRLPEVGRSLGRGIMEFKRGLREVSDEIEKADTEDTQPRTRLKPPADTYARDADRDREAHAGSSTSRSEEER